MRVRALEEATPFPYLVSAQMISPCGKESDMRTLGYPRSKSTTRYTPASQLGGARLLDPEGAAIRGPDVFHRLFYCLWTRVGEVSDDRPIVGTQNFGEVFRANNPQEVGGRAGHTIASIVSLGLCCEFLSRKELHPNLVGEVKDSKLVDL